MSSPAEDIAEAHKTELAKVGGLLKHAIALRDGGKAYEESLRFEGHAGVGSGIGIHYYAFRLVRILRLKRDDLIMKFMLGEHQEMIRLSGDVGEVCWKCRTVVREDADGCLGCACEYAGDDEEEEEDEQPPR